MRAERETPRPVETARGAGEQLGQALTHDHTTAAPVADTAPARLHIYRPGARVRLDLTARTVWTLVRNDGKRAVVRHPRGGTLAVPAWRVWLAEGMQA